MYLNRFSVKNIRSITEATMEFAKGEEAGWHVILGSNGAGKSSMVRAFALLMMGEKEAWAARQDFAQWMRKGEGQSSIEGQVSADPEYDYLLRGDNAVDSGIALQAKLTAIPGEQPQLTYMAQPGQPGSWTGGVGWFSASFGPFRRFTGGDSSYDRLFKTNKRLAPHLTALGEDVALTDALGWLDDQAREDGRRERNDAYPHDDNRRIYRSANEILRCSNLLQPDGTHLRSGAHLLVTDVNGVQVTLDQLSDGYRSALSFVIELIRQMCALYGEPLMLNAMNTEPGKILAPGVVAIDEVDVHLHPTWQRDIGKWLTRCFPNVQFIVTTHSPIVCRAIARDDGSLRGSVWRLPAPGTDEQFRRVDEDELNQLVYGDVLDAYATELFGRGVLRSHAGDAKLERLAELNTQALNAALTPEEQAERRSLRKVFPGSAGVMNG
jgi:predicted ATPase